MSAGAVGYVVGDGQIYIASELPVPAAYAAAAVTGGVGYLIGGELNAVLAAETHAGCDIGGVAATDDCGGTLVDHGVVHGASPVVGDLTR